MKPNSYSLVLLFFFTAFILQAQYVTDVVCSQDTYVRDGKYSSEIYGLESTLVIKQGSSDFCRNTYLKFDLNFSDLLISDIDSVILLLTTETVNGIMDVSFYTCASDWLQINISYDNAPDILNSNHITTLAFTSDDGGKQLSIDVTDAVKTQLADGLSSLSFVMAGDAETKKTMTLSSSEAASGLTSPTLQLYTSTYLGTVPNDNDLFSLSVTTIDTPEDGSQVCLLLDSVKGTEDTGEYGGWLNQQLDSTGFFHTQMVDSIWYVVDPTGNVFYIMGITSVDQGGDISFPEGLTQYGINTMGNWSDETIAGLPFTPRFTFLQSYKNTTDYRKTLFAADVFPVFDTYFTTWVDEQAEAFVAPYINNPWVLGYHTDNELRFHYLDIENYLAIDASDANYIAASEFLMARHGNITTISDEDKEDFQGLVASTYMQTVNDALKRHDPNHMNIGCRVHAAVKYDANLMAAIGAHLDIMSINFYARWASSTADMDMWMDACDAPFLITEFYTKGEDSGLDNIDGAGWKVYTQDDRASHFENMALTLMGHPGSAGWTYFRYKDKNDSNRGIVDINYQLYEPLASSMQQIAQGAYNLRRYLLGLALLVDNIPTTMLLSDDISTNDVSVFPNPCGSIVNVQISTVDDYHTVTIYDINGRRCYTQSITSNTMSVDISKLPEGMYWLYFTGDAKATTESLLVSFD